MAYFSPSAIPIRKWETDEIIGYLYDDPRWLMSEFFNGFEPTRWNEVAVVGNQVVSVYLPKGS